MPVYHYKCDKCREESTDVRLIKDRDEVVTCDCGGKKRRNLEAEFNNGGKRGAIGDWTNPILSDAMGVSAAQVAEHRQRFPDVAITNDGRVVCESLTHRRKIMKKLGFHDKDGYD